MTIQLADVTEIVVSPKRQRAVFDEGKHVELCDSIQNPAIGLLHPIVLRDEDGKKTLVAGERRLRAFRDSADLGVICYHAGQPLPLGKIPFMSLGQMDPLDAWEAELEENIKRVDLTWQERANATQELMELRRQQAEKKGAEPPTTASISVEVRGSAEGGYQGDTRAELLVARHLHDADVRAAPSLKKAMQVVKRKEETRRNEAVAATLGRQTASELHTLIHGDSDEWAAKYVGERFDVILMDPPYGMGADDFGDSGGMAAGEHAYADDEEMFRDLLIWLPAATMRLTKDQAHLYWFCDIDWFQTIKEKLTAVGWKVFRTPLIWHKPGGSRMPWPEQGPQRCYELILYAVKGKMPVQKIAKDVLAYSVDENLGHAAQKPVALFQDLLSRSAVPGMSVLDMFCGTGTIFPSAHELKVRATGIERAAAAYGIAAQRIKGLS